MKSPAARAAVAAAAVAAVALVARLLDGYPLPALAVAALGLDTLLRRVGFAWGAPEETKTRAWASGAAVGLGLAALAFVLARFAPGARVGEGRVLVTGLVLGGAGALVAGVHDELLGRGLVAWVTEGAPPALRLVAFGAAGAAFGVGAGAAPAEVAAEGALGLALGGLWLTDGHGSRAVAARVAILFVSGTLLHGHVTEILGVSDGVAPPRGVAFGWTGAGAALAAAAVTVALRLHAARAPSRVDSPP